MTGPVRLARRLVRGGASSPEPAPERLDSWLEAMHGETLAPLDAACAADPEVGLELFADLDDDLWAALLTRQYSCFPHISARLPEMPEASLQELWNGASGTRLADQGRSFYAAVRRRYTEHGSRPLAESRVLDFGCGWGRLTRFFTRDVGERSLFACDPVEAILERFRSAGVPAQSARSEFQPKRLPFEGPFDLVFAFSVFTHLSEPAHEACLGAIHAATDPGSILVVTVRPPEYRELSPWLAGEPVAPYLFAPHPAEPGDLQYGDGEMAYGETVISLPYIRERWGDRWELLDIDLQLCDLHQVILTLRRRP